MAAVAFVITFIAGVACGIAIAFVFYVVVEVNDFVRSQER